MSSRLYPERPILAASVAVFREGRVLLAARTAPPYDQVFSLPGGLVEPGESLQEAALRELGEETGVTADIIGFAGHVEIIERDADQRIRRHFVVAAFAGRWLGGEGEIGEEAAAILWTRPDETAGLTMTPGLPDILARARALIEGAA
jgi:8-oxo-dGTP diphosphatase